MPSHAETTAKSAHTFSKGDNFSNPPVGSCERQTFILAHKKQYAGADGSPEPSDSVVKSQPDGSGDPSSHESLLTRLSHRLSAAASDPGMSTALRSFWLLDVLSSTPAGPLVARHVFMPVCARLATKPCEKGGLIKCQRTSGGFLTIKPKISKF